MWMKYNKFMMTDSNRRAMVLHVLKYVCKATSYRMTIITIGYNSELCPKESSKIAFFGELWNVKPNSCVRLLAYDTI